MQAAEQIDELICVLATWDRPTLTRHFMTFESRFPIDFTPEYLAHLSVDQLRHVLLAIYLQNQRLPHAAAA